MKSSAHSLRWVMIALAFFATVINYLDRQTLSVAAPVLIDQFHMSNTAYARVIFVFMLAYTIANGISGPVLDRLGTRLGFALTMAWWSAADMLQALAHGPVSLGVYRFLLGLGEAGNWPAGVKVVAEWFPAKERALASGIFNSGSAAGAILAPPVVVWLLLRYGSAPGLHLGWRDWLRVAGDMAVGLSHAGRSKGRGRCTQGSSLEVVPQPFCLGLHAGQSIPGSRVVLLYFLVP